MALEGLKILAEMAEEQAPYYVPPVPLAKQLKINGKDGIDTGSNSSNSNRGDLNPTMRKAKMTLCGSSRGRYIIYISVMVASKNFRREEGLNLWIF